MVIKLKPTTSIPCREEPTKHRQKILRFLFKQTMLYHRVPNKRIKSYLEMKQNNIHLKYDLKTR